MFRVLTARLGAFVREEDGPTAVEYAVMLALVIVVCLAAVAILGGHASGPFTDATTP